MRDAISKISWIGIPGRGAILILVAGLGLTLAPAARAAQTVTLAWNPSPDSTVVGYTIHYGNNGTNYSNQVDTGTNTSWNVTGLQEGQTNYFVVAAFDGNHNESPPSNQAVYYVPGVVQLSLLTAPQRTMAVNFPVAPGYAYTLQASTDLKNWQTIWQTTATSNTWVQFQDPAAPNLPMRFYRTVAN